ncbi:hypothetical protein BS47DRAFT_1348091 [Hydnum rufescens UP504]|uniref:Uncharacterized protein n=1 Tax=Hydnum rufescens UP504 TaxID=1448309 RepID=A0A9P6AR24_9AGAM|nr:hypothetical protein BS47DRAFT_1348091 [Hydnum rufescens UP504]
MFSIFRTLFFLGALSYAACSPLSMISRTPRSAPLPPPEFELVFICNLFFDIPSDFSIVTPKWTRVTLPITGGNWTTPEGKLIATVVPGIGGEWGKVDASGTLFVDSVYFVQFVHDKKYAYSYLDGYGVPSISDNGRAIIETDSPKYAGLNNITFFAPGILTEGLLVSPHWAPVNNLG